MAVGRIVPSPSFADSGNQEPVGSYVTHWHDPKLLNNYGAKLIMAVLREIKEFTPIEEVAKFWNVTPKTIRNWLEFVYQAFGVVLPQSGDLPKHGVEMLAITAKHISPDAGQYYTETGEKRRLRSSEFIAKIRRLREQGHFQDFQNFQNFQNFQPTPLTEDIEDDLLADIAELGREGDGTISQIRGAIEQQEDQEIESLAQFIEESPRRKMLKLRAQLQARKALQVAQDQQPCLSDVIDVVYREVGK
jgi:hypothetical protein